MKYGRGDRADPAHVTERRAKAEANVREANLRHDVEMNRLERDWSRCRCGHSKTVHEDKVCQMDGCECDKYRKQ